MTKRIKILGLDVGSATGWCVYKGTSLFFGSDTFPPPKKGRKTIPDEIDRRFLQFHGFLGELLNNHPDLTHIVYECPGARSRSAGQILFGFRGIMMAYAAARQLTVKEVSPQQVKLFATTRGDASKAAMAKAWRNWLKAHPGEFLNAESETPNEDEVDAIWMAILGYKYFWTNGR